MLTFTAVNSIIFFLFCFVGLSFFCEIPFKTKNICGGKYQFGNLSTKSYITSIMIKVKIILQKNNDCQLCEVWSVVCIHCSLHSDHIFFFLFIQSFCRLSLVCHMCVVCLCKQTLRSCCRIYSHMHRLHIYTYNALNLQSSLLYALGMFVYHLSELANINVFNVLFYSTLK